MKCYLFILHGMVQGVGCRYHVYQCALNHQIAGSVRNLDNGDVEIIAEAEEERFNQFFQAVVKGNGFMQITDYSIKEIDLIHAKKFRMEY